MLTMKAPRPIVFALANPDLEIAPEEVRKARNDAIIATGRSDAPNQVNNVLGFPFIFRGALDVRASAINVEMTLAVTLALVALVKEAVPSSVCQAYGLRKLAFGPDYIVPKPFDPRALVRVSSAVPREAMASGVARRAIDFEEYTHHLEGVAARLQGGTR
jgi:malate dehydrogenase (oxaloacetate-decarboxylating)(NADP+)